LSRDRLPEVNRLDADEVLAGFVPTRRFLRARFDTYEPDARFPSQRTALERMQAFATSTAPRRHGLKLFRRAVPSRRAIYLDGGYGVGKTHLLAATYHAAHGQRFYLSFAELAYTITRLGIDAALDAFSGAQVLCVDEFELDDVAQTRMASMFLRQLFDRSRAHVVTTSNTLPSDLGRGRFAAEAFQREIGEIARLFETVSIDGEDYRHRRWDELGTATPADVRLANAIVLDWAELARELERVHPIHYAQIAAQVPGLQIVGLETVADQAVALRLVHFVDKLYDQEVRLALSADVPLTELFAASYRHGGYEKKYRRCLSRLHELLRETEVGERIAAQVELG
jgi:cell division protein ZapE